MASNPSGKIDLREEFVAVTKTGIDSLAIFAEEIQAQSLELKALAQAFDSSLIAEPVQPEAEPLETVHKVMAEG